MTVEQPHKPLTSQNAPQTRGTPHPPQPPGDKWAHRVPSNIHQFQPRCFSLNAPADSTSTPFCRRRCCCCCATSASSIIAAAAA